MKKLELLNLLGDLLIEDFEKEMEEKGKKLIDKEINRLQLMNIYKNSKMCSLVWNIRNYAKKLNKFDNLPVFCQVSYANGSDKK